MASRIGRKLSALALPLLATPALAQDFNNLEINNGGDILFFYNDPSIGAPVGDPNGVDLDGDFWWKVYDRNVTLHPLGTLNLTGFTIEIYDTDWVATPVNEMHDTVLTPGVVSIANPGNIEPDFNSALGTEITGGPGFFGGALTNPCPNAALNCPTSVCPPAGFVVGYIIGIDLTGGTGTGLILQADGATDWTYSTFVPGGFTYSGAGSCGIGDGVLQDVHSTDEGQVDVLGTGFSKYGGFHTGGTGVGVYTPDALTEVYAEPLEFGEPISEPRYDLGTGPSTGLAALNPSVAGGTLGMRYWDASGAGELGFFFGSFFPLIPAPGIPIFDINIMINIADPVASTVASIWNGPIVGGQGTFNDDGILDTAMVTVPPAAIGFTFNVQGFNFNPGNLDFDNSQVLQLPMQP